MNVLREVLKSEAWEKHCLMIVLQFVLLGWAGWVLLPLSTFASTVSFSVLAVVMTETGWGLSGTLVAVFTFVALLTDETKTAGALLCIGSLFWFVVCASFALANLANTAVPVCFALGCVWLYCAWLLR